MIQLEAYLSLSEGSLKMRNRKLFKSVIIITTALLFVGCGNKVEPVDAEPTGTVVEESTEESLESVEPTPSPTVEPTAEPEEESVESSSVEESSDALESEESSAVEDSSESLESAESTEDESQSTGIEIVEELDKNMYTQNACNARVGDSTDYEKVASLAQSISVHVTGRTANNWYRVDWNNEVVYISSSLLGDNAPVVQQQASGGDNSGGNSGGSSGVDGENNDNGTWQAGDTFTNENGDTFTYGGSVDF